MIFTDGKSEAQVNDREWHIVSDLLVKWNINPPNKEKIKVGNLDDILPELSAWGIPWRRTSIEGV